MLMVWVVLALVAAAVLSRTETYEDLMYPGQPARFFDTDARGTPLRWARD